MAAAVTRFSTMVNRSYSGTSLRMTKCLLLSCVGALLLCATYRLRAQALYNNGAPNLQDGYEMTGWIAADDFTVSAPARLTSLKFWNLEGVGRFQGAFLWQIYANSSTNTPGALLISGTSENLVHTATGLSFFGYAEFLNTCDIAPIFLSPGTYWLALHHGPLSNDMDERIYWEVTDRNTTNPSHILAAPFDGSWFPSAPPGYRLPSELAFQINGMPAPQISALTVVARLPRINFNTVAGQSYRVEFKNNVSETAWNVVDGAEAVRGSGSVVQVTDNSAGANGQSRRFYRVVFSYDPSAAPRITAFALNGGPARVSFSTAAGSSYRVEYRDNLTDEFWQTVEGAEVIAGTGNIIQLTDPNPPLGSGAHRFYRVLLL